VAGRSSVRTLVAVDRERRIGVAAMGKVKNKKLKGESHNARIPVTHNL
jgi:hypothetical protein